MARVGIDAIQASPGGKGLSLVQRKLAQELARLSRHEVVAFVREDGRDVVGAAAVEPIRERLFLMWQQWGMPSAARRLRLDAVVTLTDRLPLWGRVPFVVWLFEVPTHRMEQAHGLWQRGSDVFTAALWKPSLRRAARVVAGSEATLGEIEDAVPQLRGRVRVIYPGLADGFWPGEPDPDRYVFHLGSTDPRDNTETVIEAFRLARERLHQPVRLVVGGDLGGRTFEGVEMTGRLSDADLAARYRGASAYLDASLYEGFGYQPLEALASGTPVIASNTSSIPEVVGQAGILCDPRSAPQFADALVRVLSDAQLAAELARYGPEQAARFTWERTAREFAALLEEVVA